MVSLPAISCPSNVAHPGVVAAGTLEELWKSGNARRGHSLALFEHRTSSGRAGRDRRGRGRGEAIPTYELYGEAFPGSTDALTAARQMAWTLGRLHHQDSNDSITRVPRCSGSKVAEERRFVAIALTMRVPRPLPVGTPMPRQPI